MCLVRVFAIVHTNVILTNGPFLFEQITGNHFAGIGDDGTKQMTTDRPHARLAPDDD